MKLTGLQIRNMQMLQDLEKMIKELEINVDNFLIHLGYQMIYSN